MQHAVNNMPGGTVPLSRPHSSCGFRRAPPAWQVVDINLEATLRKPLVIKQGKSGINIQRGMRFHSADPTSGVALTCAPLLAGYINLVSYRLVQTTHPGVGNMVPALEPPYLWC
jgi:hypothetical protein